MKSSWMYILTSKTGTLYAGVTNNLTDRIYQHKNKLVPGFTSKYNIDRLVYYQEFSDINQAIEMEKKVKGWTRSKKMELIRGLNPTVKDLADNSNLEILHSVQDDGIVV